MRQKQFYSACIIASSLLTVGCAHQAAQNGVANPQAEAMKVRLEESERINGRLTVRVEELEDQIFLLQDRVDANRIALQRRGMFGGKKQYARNDAPNASPETYYPPQQQYTGNMRPQKKVTRIPLNNPETYVYEDQPVMKSQPDVQPIPKREEEVVISEAEFEAFVSKYDGSPKPKANSNKTRVPQPDVTDERLPTSDELGKPPEQKKKEKRGLALYKESLAQYRDANYADALTGFEAFLASKPKSDYIDNALYWIGECHFGLGSHGTAISYFQRVLSESPDGNKVPDALLKMSLAYERIGKSGESTKLLKDLATNYPATNAGKLGAQKLSERGQ